MSAPLLPDSLLLNGREFRYADIQQYPTNVPSDLNGYEGKVLDFCRQWLNGAQEFGLRVPVLTVNGRVACEGRYDRDKVVAALGL